MKLQKPSTILFINVAKDICSQDIIIDESHPSIKVIEEKKTDKNGMLYHMPIQLRKQLNKVN